MQEHYQRPAAPKNMCRWACAATLVMCCATATLFFADQLWLIPAILTFALTVVATFALAYPISMLAMGAPMFVLVSAAAGLTVLFRCIHRVIKDGISLVSRV